MRCASCRSTRMRDLKTKPSLVRNREAAIDACLSGCATCHDSNGHCRLPSALLDRTPGSICDLRFQPCRDAGPVAGIPEQAYFADVRDDPAPQVLPIAATRSCRRKEEARPQSGLTNGSGVVRNGTIDGSRESRERTLRDAPLKRFREF